MTHPEIFAALHEIFADAFMRDDIALSPETSAKDISGWDSFKHIEILVAVEARFSFKLTSREIDTLETVDDLVRLVALRTDGR